MQLADANLLGGLLGGLMIGAAAVLLLAVNGRIAGISGIMGGLLAGGVAGDRAWRWAFLAGLLGGAALYGWLGPGLPVHIAATPPWLVAAGLLVGFGTRLGSGCTSGHGVCGVGRRSPRSLAATAVFVGTAMLTVLVMRSLAS